MRNVNLRIISFKQSPNSQEYLYALGDRKLKMGDYYYNRYMGRLACIQKVGHRNQLEYDYPVIEATSDPKYDDILKIPQNFVDYYFKNNKSQKTIQLRLP